MWRMGRSRYIGWFQATLLCAVVTLQVAANTAPLPRALNIDCGWSEPPNANYTSTGITWVGDQDFISTGINSDPTDNTFNVQLRQSQFFNDTRQSRYCYDVPLQINTMYLIRAAFDKSRLDNSTVFNITINSTFWATVQQQVDANDDYMSKDYSQTVFEGVFLSQGSQVFMCLLPQLGTPFISYLQLRPLASGMFEDARTSTVLLVTRSRLNLGVNWNYDMTEFPYRIVRYPDDPYDRFWQPQPRDIWFPKNSTGVTRSQDAQNQSPPLQVMMSAAVSTGNPDSAFAIEPESPLGSFYTVLYFQKVEEDMGSSETLSMTVQIQFSETQEKLVNLTSEISSLEFRGYSSDAYMEYSFTKNTPSNSMNITLNALEIYSEYDLNTSSTNGDDVGALKALRKSFGLEDWTGDPCFPSPWTWLACNSAQPARVTHVKLSGMGLIGFIPPEITRLMELTELWLDGNHLIGSIPDLSASTDLAIVHLENNNLSGSIPIGLASMQSLTKLSVENNSLSGPLPEGLLRNGLNFRFWNTTSSNYPNYRNVCLSKVNDREEAPHIIRRFAAFSSIYYDPNLNCRANEPICRKKSYTWAIVGTVVGITVLGILMGLAFWYLYGRKRKRTDGKHKGRMQVRLSQRDDTKQAVSFSLKDLKAATNNFSLKLGEGSFGPVYYGKLSNGQEVAVKVNAADSKQGADEFVNEVVLLSRVHYKHLVSLVGYCEASNQQILIYEYMCNGTLRDHLSGERAKLMVLDMGIRLSIAIGAARGLEYMHKGCNPRIVHRDVKSTNILLNDQLVAKVADFGLSKSSIDETSGFSTVVKGTPGYLDPEYFVTQRLTEKSDVYSFGVVLLELVTGMHPMKSQLLPNGIEGSLKEQVRIAFQEDILHTIVDPVLEQSYNKEAMDIVVKLALSSTDPRPGNRPDMTDVVQGLIEAKELESPSERAPQKETGEFLSLEPIEIPIEMGYGDHTNSKVDRSESQRLLQFNRSNEMTKSDLYPR